MGVHKRSSSTGRLFHNEDTYKPTTAVETRSKRRAGSTPSANAPAKRQIKIGPRYQNVESLLAKHRHPPPPPPPSGELLKVKAEMVKLEEALVSASAVSSEKEARIQVPTKQCDSLRRDVKGLNNFVVVKRQRLGTEKAAHTVTETALAAKEKKLEETKLELLRSKESYKVLAGEYEEMEADYENAANSQRRWRTRAEVLYQMLAQELSHSHQATPKVLEEIQASLYEKFGAAIDNLGESDSETETSEGCRVSRSDDESDDVSDPGDGLKVE